MSEAPQAFPSTRWASVLAARDGRDRTAHLDHLFRAYWTPVYCYIRGAWRKPEEESRDLTQEFFARLLETDFLRGVDPAKGRFRSYVKACLRHFLLDERKHERAQKRGGDVAIFSLDGAAAPIEPAAKTPEEAFDLEWVASLFRAALPDLERALRSAGRAQAYDVFRRLDVDAQPGGKPAYADLARELGIPEQSVKSQADYARKQLRRILLERVRDYSLTDADAADEMRELFQG